MGPPASTAAAFPRERGIPGAAPTALIESIRIDEWHEERGEYTIRFARSARDRQLAQSLRYRVFCEEMGARVQGADRELDIDPLDDLADHLLVLDRKSGDCVGSYRLATSEQVGGTPGFYTERIFELGNLDASVRTQGVELGRACVALGHRSRGVFQLLLRGIGAYLVATGKRYLFGCGSVPIEDPGQAPLALLEIERQGWLDPTLGVSPTLAYQPPVTHATTGAAAEIPALLYAYCAIGARLGAAPAYDRDFKTLDFFVLLDLERVDPRVYARYCAPR